MRHSYRPAITSPPNTACALPRAGVSGHGALPFLPALAAVHRPLPSQFFYGEKMNKRAAKRAYCVSQEAETAQSQGVT